MEAVMLVETYCRGCPADVSQYVETVVPEILFLEP
jgi:hypothetical protein